MHGSHAAPPISCGKDRVNMRLALIALLVALASGTVAQPQGMGAAPFAGGKRMTTEEALKEVTRLDKSFVPMEKAFQAEEAKLKKSPKDPKVRKSYVEAAYRYGHAVMMARGGKLPPSVMYRAALALYRKALAVDPKHQPSLNDKKMIEDIYRSMGMPVPN